MTETVLVVYEKGVLRPLEPLQLKGKTNAVAVYRVKR